jgi:hypothetical protein
MPDLALIIFSKNRPAQLDLLLRSLQRFVGQWERMTIGIIVKATTVDFERGYQVIAQEYAGRIHLIWEHRFRDDTLAQVTTDAPLTMFLVDDDIVIRPFSIDSPMCRAVAQDASIACLSLRLSPSITSCYMQQRPTPPPPFLSGRRFAWHGLLGDWGYPMSLDGHVFRSTDISALLPQLTFHAPNSLESEMSKHPLPGPYMLCGDRSSVVNVPANHVQDFPSRSMGISPESLNARFLAGERLDLDKAITAVTGIAVHQEIDLVFSPSTSRGQTSARTEMARDGQLPEQEAVVPAALTSFLQAGMRRLHLGCGSRYLEGYVNIDMPSENVVQVRERPADIECDLLDLRLPSGSISEVYMAHVFEHFQRHIAIGFLCRWNSWLEANGAVLLEMPDILAGCQELATAPFQRQLQLIRHMWGSHEASWATHQEGWMLETAAALLSACGYIPHECTTTPCRWPSFRIRALKQRQPDVQAIAGILQHMAIDDAPLLDHWMSYIQRHISETPELPVKPTAPGTTTALKAVSMSSR